MGDIELLTSNRIDELRSLLSKDPVQNLYALGVLEEHGTGAHTGSGPAFYGLRDDGKLTAAAMVGGNGALCVPCVFDPDAAVRLGEFLSPRIRLRGAFGERYAVDAFTRAAGQPQAKVSRPQRLFAASADDLGPFVCAQLRQAGPADLPQVVELALASAKEANGEDLPSVPLEVFQRRVEARLLAGRTWVLDDGPRLIMKIDLGVRSRHGAEIEGVYTIPDARRRGVATNALGQLCRSLLSALPRMTIRVDDGNAAMSQVCRKVGFIAMRPQRLVTVA
ncbi:MAG: GNAT family N-acetyltransferase [Myxococcales bacterium]